MRFAWRKAKRRSYPSLKQGDTMFKSSKFKAALEKSISESGDWIQNMCSNSKFFQAKDQLYGNGRWKQYPLKDGNIVIYQYIQILIGTYWVILKRLADTQCPFPGGTIDFWLSGRFITERCHQFQKCYRSQLGINFDLYYKYWNNLMSDTICLYIRRYMPSCTLHFLY